MKGLIVILGLAAIISAGAAQFDAGEFLVDTSITALPLPGTNPSVAFDGDNFLVVWEGGHGSQVGICGARVTPTGALLDPTGFAISTAAGDQLQPVVAFDGSGFLVVWQDRRNHPDSGDIYAARVSREGLVLDPDGIPVSCAAGVQLHPDLAFDGANLLVVWEDERNSPDTSDIYGARVTAAGVVLDTAGIVVSTVASSGWPAVAFDGTNHLVVWQDDRNGSLDVYGARVNQAGAVLDPDGIPVSSAAGRQSHPDLAFDGENFLAVWDDGRSSPDTFDIYGTRVTPAGEVLDTAGIGISVATRRQRYPALAHDGTDFMVVWQHSYNTSLPYAVSGARVTSAGTVLDSAGISISENSSYCPAVAFGDEHHLVVHTGLIGLPGGPGPILVPFINGVRVTPEGVVLDPLGDTISTEANDQASPAVTFGNENFLTVWQDGSSWLPYSSGICGARVTPEGVVLDSTRIDISTRFGFHAPAVAFDGENFLVVWEDEEWNTLVSDVYGARVTSAGEVLDTAGIVITQTASSGAYPAVAFDGENYIVVWHGVDGIGGARVTPGGVVLDTAGISIWPGRAWGGQAIAFDGTNSLVVWVDWPSPYDWRIYGARVSRAGLVLDPDGIPVSCAAGVQSNPDLVFDGVNFLVVWEDERNGPGTCDIYCARVTPAGVVLDSTGIAISTAAGDQLQPTVAFDGLAFLVAWHDRRNHPDSGDIYGARVTPGGSVFDRGAVLLKGGRQSSPALARGTGDRMLMVYQDWAGNVGGRDYSTYRIWGMLDPIPAIAGGSKPQSLGLKLGPTIVRGSLLLSSALLTTHYSLLTPDGRKVMDLASGANDVRHLSPGVYFVCCLGTTNQELRTTTKVVVTR